MLDSSVFSDVSSEISTDANKNEVASAAVTNKPAPVKSRFFQKRNTFYISSDEEDQQTVVEEVKQVEQTNTRSAAIRLRLEQNIADAEFDLANGKDLLIEEKKDEAFDVDEDAN